MGAEPQALPAPAYDDFDITEDLFQDLTPGKIVTLPVAPPPTRYSDDNEDEEPLHGKALAKLSEWPAQFPVALALGLEDEADLLLRFDISPERYELLKPLPAFRKALAEAQKEIREKGNTFRLKCRGIAESFLDELYFRMYDRDVGLATKIDIWKHLVKMGELEPEPKKPEGPANNAPQVNIQINL